MKKADIKVGGEYAYSRDQDHYSYPSSTTRVRVLEHTETKQRFGSLSRMPGVIVQVLDRETGEPMTRPVLNDELEATGETVVVDPYTVPNRTIKESWASFANNVKAQQEAQAKYAQQKAEAEAKQAVINNAVVDELKKRVPTLGQGYGTHHFPEYEERSLREGSKTKVTLSIEVLAELLGIEVPA